MNKPDMWNVSSAKAHLSSLVDRALKGEPQRISRRGEAVVVIASTAYEQMTRSKVSLLELFSSHPEIELDLNVDRTHLDAREIIDL